MLSEKVKKKLQDIPDKPGVYLMRNQHGKVIYVGKAKSLKNRVRNYFQKGTLRSADPKIRGLIRSIHDFDFLILRNEADAVLTEGRLIKEYRPRYNTFFKDDKKFLLLAFDIQNPFPRISVCRIKKNDGKIYMGPYASAGSARMAKNFIEKYFGLRECRSRIPDETNYKHCLADIIRCCAAPCIKKVTREQYMERVNEAIAFLRGERPAILHYLKKEMEETAEKLDFEGAALLRDMLIQLRKAIRQRASGKKNLTLLKEEAQSGLREIQQAFQLEALPRVIETFDVSNISGTYAVASMVCLLNGFPQKNRYRHFRIKTVKGSDDPQMMSETVHRRYRRLLDEKKPLPDLVMVDGGITQLRAARKALDHLGLHSLRVIGMAKKFEEIYWDIENKKPPFRFLDESPALKILQQIRDEAHRFALAYHRKIRQRRIRDSILDEIDGIGEKRKALVIKHMGSVERLRQATIRDISEIPGIGLNYARRIYEGLR